MDNEYFVITIDWILGKSGIFQDIYNNKPIPYIHNIPRINPKITKLKLDSINMIIFLIKENWFEISFDVKYYENKETIELNMLIKPPDIDEENILEMYINSVHFLFYISQEMFFKLQKELYKNHIEFDIYIMNM